MCPRSVDHNSHLSEYETYRVEKDQTVRLGLLHEIPTERQTESL